MKRLYITGGLGPSARNEGFTADYDLPNDTAYAETCAAVGLIFWAHRMLLVERDGRYGDMMELALYNGALSGLSLDGEHFFYDNPLASRGEHRRWTWHRCPCCPPNIGRLVASLGQYVYSTGAEEVAVHLYIAGKARLSLGGVDIALRQATQYPWQGGIELTVEPERDVDFALRMRIPSWCYSAQLEINGKRVDIKPLTDRGYAHIDRRWRKGDKVALSLDMPAQRIYAHPEVAADIGHVALRRGPIIYCLEGADNEASMHRVALPRSSPIEAHFESGLLSGVGILTAPAVVVRAWGDGALYRSDPPVTEPTTIRAIPYSFWSNRGPEAMSVWIREV